MQVRVASVWRRYIQLGSTTIAGLTALLIELAQPGPGRPLYILAGVLVGGPLSWTIRDITAVVERGRR